tara:strand:+ start:220 stop:1233 length:1014 start_codon:yes stop_codon:yes gene_type:complete
MKLIESFTGFQPLQEVWVGGTYPENFYSDLPNEVEDTFCKITQETDVGLDKLSKTLEGFGVKVRRPYFSDRKEDYSDDSGNLIKPPIAPRDWAITVGNELWINTQGYKTEPFADAINEYRQNGDIVDILRPGEDPRSILCYPGVVRFGKHVVVDTGTTGEDWYTDWHKEQIKKAVKILEKKYTVIETDSGGHLDSVYCPIREGQIFSSHWGEKDMYDLTAPGWEVFWIKTDTDNWKYNGKWWTSDNPASPIFNKHIEEKAKEWVGDSRETVFDVNMLVVDEHNVICIKEHEQSFKKMQEIGITPHVVDFPARHFWDGGMHCLTTDIRRSGGCLNYFK